MGISTRKSSTDGRYVLAPGSLQLTGGTYHRQKVSHRTRFIFAPSSFSHAGRLVYHPTDAYYLFVPQLFFFFSFSSLFTDGQATHQDATTEETKAAFSVLPQIAPLREKLLV